MVRRPDVEALSAAELAYRTLRRSIVDGTYLPGTMLSENEAAARIGVSRTPVRSALTRLQDEGWITIYPRRGALVIGLTAVQARDLAEARHVLESSGVRSASTEQRRRLATELTDSLEQQRAALHAGDVERFVDLTIEFHRSFAHIGGNSFLIDLTDRLSDRLRQLLIAQHDDLLARSDSVIAEHRQLIGFLASDDVAAFTEVLGNHLADTLGHPHGAP